MATRSKQKSLPGLGDDAADVGRSYRRTEVVAAPIRAKSRPADPRLVGTHEARRYCRLAGLRGRRPFAHFPGVSRPAGDDQPARRACWRCVRLRPRHARPDREEATRRTDLRVRPARRHVPRQIVRPLQGRPRRNAGGAGRPDSEDRTGAASDGRAGSVAARLRSRRRAGDHRAAVRRGRGPVLYRLGRQGLPATDQRPRVGLQHPQRPSVRRGRAQRGLGSSAGPGCRFSGACGRQGRQRAGRRRRSAPRRPPRCWKHTARSTMCWSTPTRFLAPRERRSSRGGRWPCSRANWCGWIAMCRSCPIGTPAAWAGSIISGWPSCSANLAFARSASGPRESTAAADDRTGSIDAQPRPIIN